MDRKEKEKLKKDLYKLGHFISDLGDLEYVEFCKDDEDYKYLLATLQNYYTKIGQDIEGVKNEKQEGSSTD